jgi:hypothetical protein
MKLVRCDEEINLSTENLNYPKATDKFRSTEDFEAKFRWKRIGSFGKETTGMARAFCAGE